MYVCNMYGRFDWLSTSMYVELTFVECTLLINGCFKTPGSEVIYGYALSIENIEAHSFE